MRKNAVLWFEIPVSDFERARKFYNTIFDIKLEEMMLDGQQLGIFPYDRDSGGVGGAIVKAEGYVPSQNGSNVYLNGGSDLSVVLDRIEKSGGSIVIPKSLIAPGMGFYASFTDTEGNRVSLHSSK